MPFFDSPYARQIFLRWTVVALLCVAGTAAALLAAVPVARSLTYLLGLACLTGPYWSLMSAFSGTEGMHGRFNRWGLAIGEAILLFAGTAAIFYALAASAPDVSLVQPIEIILFVGITPVIAGWRAPAER